MKGTVTFLEAFADITRANAKLPRSEYAADGRLPVVDQGKELIAGFTDDESLRFKFDGPVIIFGDHTRAIKYVDFPFVMGADGVKVLRVQPGWDPRYCYHYLRSVTIPSAGYSRHFKFLREIAVPKPSLGEQKRIAAILDLADTVRFKRRQTLAHFDKLASSIFYDMFGDPVANAKAWPVHRFEDQVASMQYGPRFYNESYSPNGVRIVRITDLDQHGCLDFDSMPRMDVSEADLDKFRLTPGDIVFARTGATVGKLAIIRKEDPPCVAGAYFIRVRLKESVEPMYVAAALRSRTIQSIIVSGSQQSAQQNFSGPGLRSLPLPVPPISLQREFCATLASLDERRMPSLQAESAGEQLFASLQSRVFKGQP